jgi:hypothetical protein
MHSSTIPLEIAEVLQMVEAFAVNEVVLVQLLDDDIRDIQVAVDQLQGQTYSELLQLKGHDPSHLLGELAVSEQKALVLGQKVRLEVVARVAEQAEAG